MPQDADAAIAERDATTAAAAASGGGGDTVAALAAAGVNPHLSIALGGSLRVIFSPCTALLRFALPPMLAALMLCMQCCLYHCVV